MLVRSDDIHPRDNAAAGIFGDAADGTDRELSGEWKNKRKQTHSSNQAGRSAHSGELQEKKFFRHT